MTNHYELTFILSATRLNDDNYRQTADAIKASLQSASEGEIKEDLLGKRKLAYPIKKERYGYYVSLTGNFAADKLAEANHILRHHDDVLRHLIIIKPILSAEQQQRLAKLHERLAVEAREQERERTAPERITRREPIAPPKPEIAAEKPVDTASLEKKLDEILKDEDSMI